ncbi:hypothetical protein [uncultured Desulfobulbus sp.]|uniref:leucine-rich repeat domain-containing protein n=1 Tax=uncultured Desulfobulbus sp. TaxID=239745 RepID=UPI0029C78DF0|nr:hypothetical protein [uncultured Desulfobulbus sp.]
MNRKQGAKPLHTGLWLLLLMALLTGWAYSADPPVDPATIRAEMMKIRRSTNWNDPKAVKEANERVRQLTAQLESMRLKQEAVKAGATEKTASEAVEESALNRATGLEHVEQSAAKGRGTGIDLSEEVRDKIVQEYEEDRNPTIKNPAVLEELTLLIIDFSLPQTPQLIDQIDQFKAVRTLILKGTEASQPVDLEIIFEKARKLPLRELHIINFRRGLTNIPESLATFSGLTKLSLFNNNFNHLPAALGQLNNLTILYLDANPFASILPAIGGLQGLKELGIAKTGISAAEVAAIKKTLPDCQVVSQ